MRSSLMLIALACIWARPVGSATVYDLFVNKGSIELALRVEMVRNQLLGREAVADCMAWKFAPSNDRDRGFWGLERDIYSSPAPGSETVEGFIVSRIIEACLSPANTPAWQPKPPAQYLRRLAGKDFFSKVPSMLSKIIEINLAISTQKLMDYHDNNTARGDCIKDKLEIADYYRSWPSRSEDLLTDVVASKDSSEDVATIINRAISRVCGEEQRTDPPSRVSRPENTSRPQSKSERRERQELDDLMRELDDASVTTSRMLLDEKAKVEAARAKLAEAARHAYRVPDGRRIYPRGDGEWLFENSGFVPSELVARRISPPAEGWPTLDMRSPP